jgi:hypothetical protein
MSIAQKIEPILLQRQASAAAKAAERAARDSFIQAQFVALTARFDEMLRTSLGFHSRIVLTVTEITLDVHCRTFATLDVPVWTIVSTIDAAPKTVIFTPKMDFSLPDQFGTLVCELDFRFLPRRSTDDRIASALLHNGVRLRGTQFGQLTLAMPEGPRDLSISDLESAFGVWWLRA